MWLTASFLVDSSGIEEIESEQCVCQTCEESMKECMWKRDEMRVQRDMCCVSSCSVIASIRKYPCWHRDV